MNRILFGILMCILVSAGTVQGQNRINPFDLLYRNETRPETASIVADPSKPNPEVVPPAPARTPPIPADTIVPDTTLQEAMIGERTTRPGNVGDEAERIFLEPSVHDLIPDSAQIRDALEETASESPGNDMDSSKAPASIFDSGDSLSIGEIIPVLPQEQILKREKLSGAFHALIFLGILLMLTIIVNINRKLLYQVYRASLNENYSALLYRERKHSAFNYLYSIAYAIFFINAGLFIYQAQFLDIWFHPDTYALWVFILFPIVIYTIRHLVMRLLATVFPITKEINQFNFNIVVFNIIIGLFLIPVNLFIAFGPELLQVPLVYTAIVAIGLFYIFRQLRGVLIATPILQNSLFLFFIYLCTVEILPLAVIFKLLA